MKNKYTHAVFSNVKIIIILLFTLPVTVNAQQFMRGNLYMASPGGYILMDGNLTDYDSIYSNAVDFYDAWKLFNPGCNFGILRDGQNLAVERRSIIGSTDTTFFRMWNMPQHDYRIKFMLKNLDHPGMFAVVKDKYLNTETLIALNDTTYYDFTINSNPASSDQMRFQLIYNKGIFAPVSVNFTGIQAKRKGKVAIIQWDVANEESMLTYTVEHSADGSNFKKIGELSPYNSPHNKTYDYTDMQALTGDNFYRIKALSISGRIQYSSIVKVAAVNKDPEINVYPNPVIGKKVQLQFTGQLPGKYEIVLLYGNGSSQLLKSIQVNSTQSTQTLDLPQNITPGIYQLQLAGPNNLKIIKLIEVL